MKNKSLIISLIINFIISILKFVCGIIFNLSSLFADGIHTLSDFFVNIFLIISNNLSKKRSNKKHPHGYGMIQYIFNFIIGIIILFVGLFIFFRSFHVDNNIPSYNVIYVIVISFLLKAFAILNLYHEANKNNDKALLLQAEASKTDLYSSVLVFFITILLQFSRYFDSLKYLDNIGSLIISLMIFKTAFIILKENFCYLIGYNDADKQKYLKVEKMIKKYKNIEVNNISFINYGAYYLVDIDLVMDSNTTLKNVTNIEKLIIRKLKNSNLKIKHVNINTVSK